MSSKLVESMLKIAGVQVTKKVKQINELDNSEVRITRDDKPIGDEKALANPDEMGSPPEEMGPEAVTCPLCGDEMGKGDFYDHMMHIHDDVMCPNLPADNDAEGETGDEMKTGSQNVELKFEGKEDMKKPQARNLEAKYAHRTGAGAHELKGGKKAKRAKQKQEFQKDLRMEEAAKKAEKDTNFLTDMPKEIKKDKLEQNVHDKDKKFDGVSADLNAVKKDLKDKKAELLKKSEELKHEDLKSAQQAEDLADVIDDLLTHLDKNTVEEFKKAQILATSLWSQMMHQIPDSFWHYMTKGGWVSGDGKKAKDLKDYFNVVKTKGK